MKIALISLTKLVYPYINGGVEIHVYNLAQQLQLKGHYVTIYCSKHSIYEREFYSTNQYIEEQYVDGIRIKIAWSYSGLKQLLLRDCNSLYDVLHFHAYRSVPLSPKILDNISVPIVFTPHAIFPPTSKFNLLLQIIYDRVFGKPLLDRSNVVMALNRKNMVELERLGVSSDKILIIPNSINLREFISLPSGDLFRKKYGIDNEYLLFNGRIVEHKGVHTLLEAMTKVRNELSLGLVIIGRGEGKYHNKILKFLQNNGLNNNVLLLENLDREMLLSAYMGSKIFILPSFQEGLPTVLLEAMVMGKICIASKTAGYDLINDHINGYSFSTGNSSELAELILEISKTDPKKTYVIGLNAKNTVVNEFSWAINVSKIESVYRQLISL